VVTTRTGDFACALDDKGRIVLPAKVRAELPENQLVVTKSVEPCLWVFTMEEWKAVSSDIMSRASLWDEESRSLVRWVVSPAQTIEIDRTGRIVIPQSLREYAGLAKEARLLWMMGSMELWDAERLTADLEVARTRAREAMQKGPRRP
jgi:MraZ protein